MEKKREHLAQLLYESQQSKIPIPPLVKVDNTLTINDAYQIQLINVERLLSEGEEISGKKIGLTSPKIQEQMGVYEPDYGHLYKSKLFEFGEIPTKEFLQPKIEGELAFVLKSDLSGGQVTPTDVLSATDYIVAAFEIVDSRVADWNITIVDTVADNASFGCYILGKEKVLPLDVDLLAVEMKLYKNGVLVEEGLSAAVLGNPLNAVAWLANRLWDYNVVLKKGEVILSGAFTKALMAKKGDQFTAEFSSFGNLTASFV